MEYMQYENIWLTKSIYEDAETKYYENLAKAPASETQSTDHGAIKFFEKKAVEFEKTINAMVESIKQLELRLSKVEKSVNSAPKPAPAPKPAADDDDDVDLFGSESEEENEAAAKLREERLAAYNAKKSKKPALIAKSNVILDVKPWDDETDMKELENQVRKISSDGLLWGAAKLVPLAYGIHKLQISCVVEDEKISIDWLQDEITAIEDYVQSVDIAAFNKI
ncbi:elongation factor 1-delta isoform X2 [Tribolium castaneum]|uniref:elongation factor 1-delta isoform X2 n=1 Tax=Tribolium castaneum TaxID=7070 RepID=UPI00046BF617|nr:PREDICTED: elongation factor 1-delta isoform X2 [Tribolium castaneum]|eukprot:XP_008199043.1 PREDICTED: elongation factor 1-delta isoform X2 [Tribolium castaneum]